MSMNDKKEWVLVPREPTQVMLSHGEAWGYSTISDGTAMARQVYADMLAAAPKPESAEAVAWHTEDHLTDKSATTYDPAVRDRWIAKGWPVTPLYTAPPRPEASERVCPECRGSKTVFGGGGPAHRTNEYPCDTCRGTGRVPAPRPEASAPVGVEGASESLFKLADEITEKASDLEGVTGWSGLSAKETHHTVESIRKVARSLRDLAQQPTAEYADADALIAYLDSLCDENDEKWGVAQDAIAGIRAGQQPAAVDEATRRDAERYRYLRRPEAWKEDYMAQRGASPIFIGDGWRGAAKDGDALDAAIDRILAGQQQGGPQE